MFQFTTTTVINSLSDFTTGKALITFANGVLNIKRLNPFKLDCIEKIWKSAPVAATPDVVTLTGLTEQDKDIRIGLYIRSVGNADPMYANDLVFKGKPLFVEIPAGTTAANMVDVVNKYMNFVFGGVQQLIPTMSGSNLVLTCVNPYQRVTKVTKAVRDDNTGEFGDGSELSNVVTVGNEGFGDYDHIMKDLRLPTGANLRWKRTMEDEMPVPGATYYEYVLDYCVNRGIMGISAVGELVKSKTTHVLLVNSSIVTAFETALGDAASKIEDPKNPSNTTEETSSDITEGSNSNTGTNL